MEKIRTLEIQFNKKQGWSSLILKSIIMLSSLYGILMLPGLTYFTQLSNLAIILIMYLFWIFDIVLIKSHGRIDLRNNKMYTVKFMLTVTITITGVVFATLLAPTYGSFIESYTIGNYASLCLHAITPILAVVDFLLFDYRYRSTKWHALYATVPPLIYVGFVVIAGQMGMRWGEPPMIAPYNFLNYEAPCGWIGFEIGTANAQTLGIGVCYMIIVLFIVFMLLGELYLVIKNKIAKRHNC